MKHTLASLRLNLEEARKGRTWLMFPEEYRDVRLALEYPLPTDIKELEKIATIPIKAKGRDCGCVYIKRAHRAWLERMEGTRNTALNIERAEHEAETAKKALDRQLAKLERKAAEAVQRVNDRAEAAIASLDALYDLGKQGMEGQMRAHLDGAEWQGEKIDAEAFRQCFRMVSQAVKGLGLPSKDRPRAREAILEEAAASLKATSEALALQVAGEKETEH